MVKLNTVLLLGSFLLLLYLVMQNSEPNLIKMTDDLVKSGQANLVDRTGSDWNQSGHLTPEVGLRSNMNGPVWLPNASGERPFLDGDIEFKGTIAPWTDEVPSPANQKTTVYTNVSMPTGSLYGGGSQGRSFSGSQGRSQGRSFSELEGFVDESNPHMPPAHLGQSGSGSAADTDGDRTGPNPKTTVTRGGPSHRDSYGQYKAQDELYPNYYNKYEVFSSDYYPWWRNQHFWPYYTRSHNWMYRYPYYSYWRRPYYYNYWASPYYPSRTVLVKPYLKDMNNKTKLRHEVSESFRTSKLS